MTGRLFAVALLLVAASVLMGSAPAAAACEQWTGAPPANGGTTNSLNDVAVLGPCNAYAVGSFTSGSSKALLEHYNGTGWRKVAIPMPGTTSSLSGISSKWAVGNFTDPSAKTLILRRIGSSWAQITSPNPGGMLDELSGVAELSAGNAWAVGDFVPTSNRRTLILHWNGTKWRRVPSPNVGGASNDNILFDLDAVSAQDIWAVGTSGSGFPLKTLTLHWNGAKWKVVPSPNFGTGLSGDSLIDVAAISAKDAWAVGSFEGASGNNAMILHWNGAKWKRATLPPLGSSVLNGVAAFGPKNAWAVGEDFPKNLVLHWNGHSWKRVSLPSPGVIESLFHGLGGTPTNMWLVGQARDTGTNYYTQTQHCC